MLVRAWWAERWRDIQLRALLLGGAALCCCHAGPAKADTDMSQPRTTYGSVGLIEMPSARMAPDGELSVGGGFFTNNQRYNLGFQVLPWLETEFHYSGLQHFDPAYKVYFDRSFSAKLRLWQESDVLPAFAVGIDDIVGTGVFSGEYFVASKSFGPVDTTLGIGWGRLGSTALFRNPFSLLSHSFDTRPSLTSAGGANFNVYFHGHDAGLFGGLVWHTPLDGLSLVAEYSSDAYTLESSRGNYTPRDQMNYGVSYDLSDSFTMGMGWLYGNRLYGSIALKLDPTQPQYTTTIDAPPLPVHLRSDDEQSHAILTMMRKPSPAGQAGGAHDQFVDALVLQTGTVADVRLHGAVLQVGFPAGEKAGRCEAIAGLAAAYLPGVTTIQVRQGNGPAQHCLVRDGVAAARLLAANWNGAGAQAIDIATIDARDPNGDAARRTAAFAIRRDATRQNLNVLALRLQQSQVQIYYTNTHYLSEEAAIERMTRILMADAPPDIEQFHLFATVNGIPQREYDILRAPAERNYVQNDEGHLLSQAFESRDAPMSNPVLAAESPRHYPHLDWGIYPEFHQALFDPLQPVGVQFLLGADVSAQLLPGLTLNAGGDTSLYDDFNTARTSDSVLPHVRSDFLQYLIHGKTGINDLDAEYRTRLAPGVFALVKGGYLESMFAGGGGEILWRPDGQRWALGIDGYEVWQRNFDRLFGLQPYHVFTGHVSVYYQSPWYDLDFAVHAGKYLAGDRGLTLEVTRRFVTGVEIGAFFTKTNVPSAQFGEGSFDKGVIIRIPLGWLAPIETQSALALDLRPVQRDGGQRLFNDTTLFEETRRTSIGDVDARMSDVPLPP